MNIGRTINKIRKFPQEMRVLAACILLGDWCAEDGCDGVDQAVPLPNGDVFHIQFWRAEEGMVQRIEEANS